MDDIKDRFPHLPEKIAGLGHLAFNLWWSWHPAARMLFKRLDRKRWKETFYNPVKLLAILPKERLEKVAGDADFLKDYDQVMAQFLQETESEVCWFTENVREATCRPIAYFSLEYGLHRSLPFYAGGLGFLAGDHVGKAATWDCLWWPWVSCIQTATCARSSGRTAGRRAPTKNWTGTRPPSPG